MKNPRFYGIALLVLLLLAFPSRVFPAAREYTFAVIPASPPVVMHEQWAPFIARLSRDTGFVFRLKVYERMSGFERALSAGTPDFIFASPLQTVVAHQSQGYRPLVRGGRPVSAEVIVLKDSPTRTIADLRNRKIAFVGDKNL